MVNELIDYFQTAVGHDVRRSIQPSKIALAWRVLVKSAHGALDPEQAAAALERDFYRPLMPSSGTLKIALGRAVAHPHPFPRCSRL